MGIARLLAGNVATVFFIIMAFLQLLPWPVAGVLILAAVVLASLPYHAPGRGVAGPMGASTVSKPARTVRERAVERPVGRTERQVVVERQEPKPVKPKQATVKVAAQKEALAREKGREGPERIGVGDYLSFEVELESGEEVVGEVMASGLVNVYLLTEESLAILEMGEEFWYEAGSEGVQSATVRFTAEESGKWLLVVENADTREVSATVKINVSKTSRSVPFLRTENLGLPSEKLEGRL